MGVVTNAFIIMPWYIYRLQIIPHIEVNAAFGDNIRTFKKLP